VNAVCNRFGSSGLDRRRETSLSLLVSLTTGRQPWQPLPIAEARIVYFAKMKGRSKRDGFRINVPFKAVLSQDNFLSHLCAHGGCFFPPVLGTPLASSRTVTPQHSMYAQSLEFMDILRFVLVHCHGAWVQGQ
jgi:hypothetical protein